MNPKEPPQIKALTITEDVNISTRAREAAIDQVNKLFERFIGHSTNMEVEAVAAINCAMQLGLNFQEAIGSEQLEMWHFEGLRSQLNPKLKYSLVYHAMNLCRRYGPTHRFTSYAEAKPELQMMLVDVGMLQIPSRESQTPQEGINPDAWLVSAFSKLRREYDLAFSSSPINSWPVARLRTFVTHTKKVHDDHEAAERLLREKKVMLEV